MSTTRRILANCNSSFYEAVHQMPGKFMTFEWALATGQLPDDWQLPTYRKLQHLHLYATSSVAEDPNANKPGLLGKSGAHERMIPP